VRHCTHKTHCSVLCSRRRLTLCHVWIGTHDYCVCWRGFVCLTVFVCARSVDNVPLNTPPLPTRAFARLVERIDVPAGEVLRVCVPMLLALIVRVHAA
jgi:hypothetical protein